jgi:hypothetical protein
MEFDKETILDFLKSRGDDSKAEEADRELPEKVDTERDAGLLQRFGIDPQELLSKFGGEIPGIS